MVTRTFCDHCGLKIPVANKFYFGRYSVVETQPAQQLMYAGGGIGNHQWSTGGLQGQAAAPAYGSAPNYPVPPSKPAERYFPTVIVDLCEVCVPIWYERACNLTKATKD